MGRFISRTNENPLQGTAAKIASLASPPSPESHLPYVSAGHDADVATRIIENMNIEAVRQLRTGIPTI